MARKVFFSFHFTRDSHRVSQIRNCNVISQHFEKTPFLDWAEWQSIERNGSQAIRNWIDKNMTGAGVVVVCYGFETSKRPWVKYELEKAHRDGRGILAVDMNGMKSLMGQVDSPGVNPLYIAYDEKGQALINYNKYRTYHWINHDGRNNIDNWIETAARLGGR